MNLTVNSQKLAHCLRQLRDVVPNKPPMPILGYALLRADGDLHLDATDLEVSLSLTCPATVNVPGECALPVDKLLQMIEQFDDCAVAIKMEQKGIFIAAGEFESKLQTLPATEFPTLHEPQGEAFRLNGRALRALIAKTRYAVAERGQKFILEGALLKLSGTSMGMIATDVKRLSVATVAREAGLDAEFVVPRKTMDALAARTDDELMVTIGVNHLFFDGRDGLLTSRVVEGKFPAYERIVPRSNDKVMTIGRAALAAAVRRVGVAAEDTCAVALSFSADALFVSARSADVGEAVERVGADYKAEPLKVCVSWRHVLDFLNAAEGQSVMLAAKDEKTPLLLADGNSFINVALAMKA